MVKASCIASGPSAAAARGVLVASLGLVLAASLGAVEELSGRALDAAKKAGISPDRVGLMAVEVAGGTVVASHNPDTSFTPASNQKILTAAAALHFLGAEARFETSIHLGGPVREGVLEGDLYLVGGGDPNISGRFHDGDPVAILREWAEVLRKKGVHRIAGSIVVDDSLFDGEGTAPGWPEDAFDRWYHAEVGALSLNDNCIDVEISPGGASGRAAIVKWAPRTSHVQVGNRCRTVASKSSDLIGARRKKGTNEITVWGRCWVRAGTRTCPVNVKDPGLFFGRAFHELLAGAGIPAAGVKRGKWRGQSPPFHVHASPLRQALPVILGRSQNLHAELLLKLLGVRVVKDGSFSGGARAVARYLAEAGIETGGTEVHDGSGLSRANRTTPRAIAGVLLDVARKPHFDLFRGSLAVPGGDGTLRRRFRDSPVRDRVFAKTGYLLGVSALSGYVMRRDGTYVAFSILCHPVRLIRAWRFQEALCEILSEGREKDGGPGGPAVGNRR